MTEEVNAFNEHLEDTYNFTIEESKTDGGERGSVIYGTMSAKDVGGGYGISIPVALKTSRNDYVSDHDGELSRERSEIEFSNEKDFFKQLIAKPKEYHEHIVKCFGIARIDNKEYIVTEDLTKQNFISIKQLKEKSEILFINKNRLKKINTQFKQLGNHLEKYKIRHGDIHDGNLMINLEQCIIKMIDFGGGKVDYDMRPRLDLEKLIFFNKEFYETFNLFDRYTII